MKYCSTARLLPLVLMVPLYAQQPAAQFKFLSYRLGQINAGKGETVTATKPRYDRAENRIIFSEPDVSLFVEDGANDAPRNTYEIASLLNPDIEITRGARITFKVATMSRYTPGGAFYLTSNPPPFPDWPPGKPEFWGNFHLRVPVGQGLLPPLPPRLLPNVIFTVTVTYLAQTAGVAYYVNGIEGGARAGKYGRILVVPPTSPN